MAGGGKVSRQDEGFEFNFLKKFPAVSRHAQDEGFDLIYSNIVILFEKVSRHKTRASNRRRTETISE